MFVNGRESSFHLSAHGKILIIGTKSSNFDQDYRGNDQLIFWNSTDPATNRKDYIPKKVEIMFVAKWVNHPLTERLERVAKRQGVQTYRRIKSLGNMRALIDQLLRESAEKQKNLPPVHEKIFLPQKENQPRPASTVNDVSTVNKIGSEEVQQPKTGGHEIMTAPAIDKEVAITKRTKVGKGELKKFIEENANLAALDRKAKIIRLFTLAREANIPTTLKSVDHGLRQIRKGREEKTSQHEGGKI